MLDKIRENKAITAAVVAIAAGAAYLAGVDPIEVLTRLLELLGQ